MTVLWKDVCKAFNDNLLLEAEPVLYHSKYTSCLYYVNTPLKMNSCRYRIHLQTYQKINKVKDEEEFIKILLAFI